MTIYVAVGTGPFPYRCTADTSAELRAVMERVGMVGVIPADDVFYVTLSPRAHDRLVAEGATVIEAADLWRRVARAARADMFPDHTPNPDHDPLADTG